eukprot:9253772-Alexandrium_andersonii.AAC.1
MFPRPGPRGVQPLQHCTLACPCTWASITWGPAASSGRSSGRGGRWGGSPGASGGMVTFGAGWR